MNYFGHAAVASWSSPPSSGGGAILGAMLPDFESMSGARVASTEDEAVRDGIAIHHATDAAFHKLPAATALMRELDERLATAGCARGPRLAVAHVGVELLLDGVLVDDATYAGAFVRGIAHEPAIAWRDDGDDRRFAALLARMRAYGVPYDLRRVDAIVHRLSRILGHRPLLAPSPDDLRAIAASLAEHRPRVEVAADTVLRGVRAALAGC